MREQLQALVARQRALGAGMRQERAKVREAVAGEAAAVRERLGRTSGSDAYIALVEHRGRLDRLSAALA